MNTRPRIYRSILAEHLGSHRQMAMINGRSMDTRSATGRITGIREAKLQPPKHMRWS